MTEQYRNGLPSEAVGGTAGPVIQDRRAKWDDAGEEYATDICEYVQNILHFVNTTSYDDPPEHWLATVWILYLGLVLPELYKRFNQKLKCTKSRDILFIIELTWICQKLRLRTHTRELI